MIKDFPYGTAPLIILLLSICSATALFLTRPGGNEDAPDLTVVVFAESHLRAYQELIPAFEQKHNVKVQIQQVQVQSLQSRLSAALLSGSEVPDLVELLVGSIGFFTKGPIEDVGLLDLTGRIRSEGIDTQIVSSRFSMWSSRGHIFGLPHDIHPVALTYNRRIIEELGIDVDAIETWDDFVQVGRKITRDLDGDGTIDRFAIDMMADGGDNLELLIRQRGGALFDASGNLTMNDPRIADVIVWYIEQTRGPNRIAFPAGWGQTLAQSMLTDFVAFYFTPDWRTMNFMLEVPQMEGRFGLIPLPAWEKGGRRTSTWGGTGLCITRSCKNPELAWEFAKHIYLNKETIGRNFQNNHVLPPLKEAWDLPELNRPEPYYGGQVLGQFFAKLAPDVPPVHTHPYNTDALWRLNEVYGAGCKYYDENGLDGLHQFVARTLEEKAERVQHLIESNAFYTEKPAAELESTPHE